MINVVNTYHATSADCKWKNAYNRRPYHVASFDCTREDHSQVIWNFQFNDTSLFNISGALVVMQTANQYHLRSEHPWKDLQNCNASVNGSLYNLRCEIDSDASQRNRYRMRIIIRYCASNSTLTYRKILHCAEKNHTVIFEKDHLYQGGLCCFREHGVANLTYSDVTTTSVNVLWDIYEGDIQHQGDLIDYTKLTLRGSDFNQIYNKPTQRNKEYIDELDPCTKYDIIVMIHYHTLSNFRRNKTVSFTTKCEGFSLTLVEIILIVIGVLLFVFLISLFGYWRKLKVHRQTQRDSAESIIDLTELTKSPDPFIRPGSILVRPRSDSARRLSY